MYTLQKKDSDTTQYSIRITGGAIVLRVRNVVQKGHQPTTSIPLLDYSRARPLFAVVRIVLLRLLLLRLRGRGVSDRLRRVKPNISKIFKKRRSLLPRSPTGHHRVQKHPE